MALTVGTAYTQDLSKPSPQPNILGHKMVAVQITWDSSYPTNGEALVASDVGLNDILAVFGGQAEYFVKWADGMLEAFWFDYDAGADGIAVEVANTTNLSTTPIWLLVLGT